jgi:hypothetical protein
MAVARGTLAARGGAPPARPGDPGPMYVLRPLRLQLAAAVLQARSAFHQVTLATGVTMDVQASSQLGCLAFYSPKYLEEKFSEGRVRLR